VKCEDVNIIIIIIIIIIILTEPARETTSLSVSTWHHVPIPTTVLFV